MLIELNNVNTSIGNAHILHDISFSMEKGEIVGLIGQNGAGKSTIMKSIVGLLDYQEGEVKINDQKVNLTSHKALKNVRALIEYPALYENLTGRQHLKLYSMGEKITAEETNTIIERTGIKEFVHRKVTGYSLGQRQRLAIAITLLAKPELVILDEPMNGLDPQSTHEMRILIRELAEKDNISFLVSSHLLDELSRMADRFIMINDGKVISAGTLDDITTAFSHAHKISVATSNNQDLLSALSVYKIKGKNVGGHLEIDLTGTTLNRVLEIALNVKDLQIISINEIKTSLEDSFLEMINEQEEK